MHLYLISDNTHTQTGLRLAGVPGTVVHTAAETEEALARAAEDPKVGLVLLTAAAAARCPQTVEQFRLTRTRPLLLEIPDRHGTDSADDALSRYVKNALGITL